MIDRALAATGTGSVLHLVYESDQQHALVDLATGKRTKIRAQHEVWFEPTKVLREKETFDGVVQSDGVFRGGEIPEHATEVYASLGADYRAALSPATHGSHARTPSTERPSSGSRSPTATRSRSRRRPTSP